MFEAAVARFDQANAEDPNRQRLGGELVPAELLYAQRLSGWVLRLDPQASEALRLAARCQHIRRWTIPRESYPMTRAGYLQWRNDLKRFHAEQAGKILLEVGYPAEFAQRVQALNLKKNFPSDPESRTLEDALCLVFLEHQFADLAAKTSPQKVVNALAKTWVKMTPRAREHALSLSYTPVQADLLREAGVWSA